jgi:hypothetical protein
MKSGPRVANLDRATEDVLDDMAHYHRIKSNDYKIEWI